MSSRAAGGGLRYAAVLVLPQSYYHPVYQPCAHHCLQAVHCVVYVYTTWMYVYDIACYVTVIGAQYGRVLVCKVYSVPVCMWL